AQGGGLLALLAALHGGLREHADAARTATFLTLVLANLGLILVNRSWGRAGWRRGRSRNRAFRWGGMAVLALLALVLGTAPLSALFGFAPLDGATLLLCLLTAGAAVLWFELVKAADLVPRARLMQRREK
ncbi:hypothetical protein GTP55_28605, partial [Duganella sp. FT109W]